MSISDVKTLVQLPFGYLDHLMARSRHHSYVNDARIQIFTQSLSENMLEALH